MSYKEIIEDVGPYYVYERGKLRAPAGLEPCPLPKRQRTIVEEDISSKLQTSRTQDGSTVYTPGTLLDMCVDIVSENIHMVESFVDFPDIIGKQIYDATFAKGKFQSRGPDADCAATMLSLFCCAYGEQVMEALDLRKQYIVVNQKLDHLLLFRHLSELDIGGCKLGDDHELISNIRHLSRLTVLIIADNSLTDSGLQKMTTPMRMFGTGPLDLKVLDLSCNPLVTSRAVKYLKCFKQLTSLDMSGNRLIKDSAVIERSLCLSQEKGDKSLLSVVTRGWARELIETWKLEHSKEHRTKHTLPQACSKTSSFYGSKTKKLQLAKCLKVTEPVSRKPHLLFTKIQDNPVSESGQEKSSAARDIEKKDNPRQLQGAKNTSGSKLKMSLKSPKKRKLPLVKHPIKVKTASVKEDGDYSDEDLSLLESYRTCAKVTTGQSSLFEAMNSW